jgi:hypothetical protein
VLAAVERAPGDARHARILQEFVQFAERHRYKDKRMGEVKKAVRPPLTESLPRCDFPVEHCGVRGLPGLRLHCKFQRREHLLQDLESKEWSVKYMNEYFNAALCFETSISCAPSQVLAAFAGWMAC